MEARSRSVWLVGLATLVALVLGAFLQVSFAEEEKKPDPLGPKDADPEVVADPTASGPSGDEFHSGEGWNSISGYRVLLGDVLDAHAGLFEDPERHDFLLVPSEGESVFILDKKGKTVSVLPRKQVEWDEEGLPTPGRSGSNPVGPFVDDEGFVRFDYGGATFLLQPVPPVVGERTTQALLELIPEFGELAEKYGVESQAEESLGRVREDTEIVVLFASWSPASKFVVPPLIRTLERAKNPKLHLRLIGLDRALAQPSDEVERYHPKEVPAVVVLSSGQEIARFEGKPTRRLEVELAEALRKHAGSHKSAPGR